MITLRPAAQRGHLDFGWLDTHHSFSFGDYFDPRHMGFRSLRVINDDRIAGGAGFPMHGHRDMEILTYVLDGAIGHRDSLGSAAVVQAGEVQVMSAGTGIRHAEFNPSDAARTRLLQIWLLPERTGLTPRYDQKSFGPALDGRLGLIASPDGRDGSLVIHQDAVILAARLQPGETASHALAPGRGGWVQVASGAVTVNGQALVEGDGLAIEGEPAVDIRADAAAELLVFDLA